MTEPPTPAADREADGRTDRAQDPDGNGVAVGRWRGGVARAVYVIGGTAFGLVTSLASVHRGSELWGVWACLAIGLTAASGAVFGYGLMGWAEIVAMGSIRLSRVAAFVAQIMAIGVAMMAVGAVVSAVAGRHPFERRDGDLIGQLLVIFAGLGAVPVIAGFAAIREQAQALAGTDGELAEAILALRRVLSRSLNALGLLVALATLALGAGLQAGNGSATTQVVVFGAGLSVILALAYAPAAGALRERARALCRAVVPLTDVPPAELPARVEDRHRLELALGVDRGVFADLQSGVVILAPLLASGAAAFLPG